MKVFTLVTAAAKVSSVTGCVVVFEKLTDKVMTDGSVGSRATCREMLKDVSLTESVLELGKPSGNAEENAHSSSSAGGAAAVDAGGCLGAKLPKSNIEACCGCCGVDCLAGDAKAAKGSDEGACGCCGCFPVAAACCCWKRDG